MTDGRLVLLAASPRVAPGLLTWDAWSALHAADVVFVASEDHPLLPYTGAAGIVAQVLPAATARERADDLLRRARGANVVWLVSPDDDPGLGEALGEVLIGPAGESPVELEMLPGSYDLPGARLLDLVAVMDRLRSPAGCPWDAEQTHASLATYLVEETYETLEAIESGDRDHLREELGDLALQVVFHARVAQEHPDEPWSVDDVAAGIVDKLVRRHPHVFGDVQATTAQHVEENWETLKAAEKGRTSAVEGVPVGLPALARAAKLMARAERAGVGVPLDPDDESIGARLLALVAQARATGVDPEAELRATASRYADAVRAAEAGGAGTVGP